MANKAIGQLFGDGTWISGTIFTNPSDQTVLVDSGPLVKGSYLIGIMTATSAGCVYDVQHRNSDNTANVHSQRRRPGAGNDDWNSSNKVTISSNDRFRVLLQGALTGEIQVSMWIQELET